MALAFSERLKSFRPKQTILEAEGEAAKSKNQKGSTQWVDVMKKKRAIHEEVINLVQQQRSAKHVVEELQLEIISSNDKEKKGPQGKKRKAMGFKDEEFYISSVPTNHHSEAGLAVRGDQGFGSNRLDSAVLDLVADDSSGLQKQKSMYHWDKKGKKYVKLNNGERVTASGKVKTESGATVKANKTGIYKKWKERSHSRISMKGTSNEEHDGEARNMSAGNRRVPSFADRGNNRFTGNNRKFGSDRKQHSVPNAHVRPEVKNLDQIRKERQIKADRIKHMKKGRPTRGKKKSNRGGKKVSDCFFSIFKFRYLQAAVLSILQRQI